MHITALDQDEKKIKQIKEPTNCHLIKINDITGQKPRFAFD